MKVDADLVIRASKGDKTAFSDLYYVCYKDFFNFAIYSVGNAEDAADIVSDTFVEIWKGISKLKNPEAFAAWAFRILNTRCKREIAEIIKHRGEFCFEELGESSFCSLRNMEADITESACLSAALSKLEPDERMLLILSAFYGYKHREIAEIIGKPRGTVSSRLSRIYVKLRELMK